MCMEMEILLVFIPGILSKRCLHKCYTGSWTRKTLRQPKGLTTIYFQQVDIFIGVSSYPEGGYYGAYTNEISKSYFHPK